MIVLMESNATPKMIDRVIIKLENLGFGIHKWFC